MTGSRALFAALSFALSLAAGWGQEARNSAREPQRAARRLHIPEAQLKNARAVLRRATDLAGTLDSAPLESFSQIAEAWLQLDPDRAPDMIESIYSRLAATAAKASDAQRYRQATAAVQALLNPFADLDCDRTLELLHQWPAPPGSSGAEADSRRHMEAEFQKQIAQRLAYVDPGEALRLLPNLDPSRPADYSMRIQIAMQLGSSGDTDQAYRLADQIVADFKQRTPDAQSVSEYATFLLGLSMLDSTRFRDAFAVLPPLLTDQSLGAEPPLTVQLGNESISLTNTELSILNIFRGLQGTPQLAMSTLDAVPELKAKLESVGGLDKFLSPNIGSGSSGNTDAPPQGDGAASPTQRQAARKDTVESLFSELRGRLRKTPGKVRKRLAEVTSDPARLELAIGLARRAVMLDPDLSSAALEEATAHLNQVDPIQRRVMVLEELMSTYRQTLGEVNPDLIRKGYVIADKLREEEEKGEAGDKDRTATQADQLEATLTSEFARDNYEDAMRFVNSKPDDNIKMITLLRVLQSLRQGY